MIDVEEDIKKVLEAFDVGVFVRDVSRDHESGWAFRAVPYIAALARLSVAVSNGPQEEMSEGD